MINISQLKTKVIRSLPYTKTIARRLRYYRRSLFELLGSERYSKPAAFNMDEKLNNYLPDRGFFIEAGAHDGFFESNTYYLEKFKGWDGVLIEPVPQLYRECINQRPKAKVFNCALVSPDYPQQELKIIAADTMSYIKSETEQGKKREELVETWVKPKEVTVPAKTLTSILDELKVSKVNFLSLDVEGYEMNVLKGLDFNKYRPDYILMEFFLEETTKEEIEAYISDYYVFCSQLSERDHLYKCINHLAIGDR